MRLQKRLAAYKLLIIDELGFVPLSKTGVDVPERGLDPPGDLLDRLTHHVHILEMNGESYRLKQSRSQQNNKPR